MQKIHNDTLRGKFVANFLLGAFFKKSKFFMTTITMTVGLIGCSHFSPNAKKNPTVSDINEVKDELVQLIRTEIKQEVLADWRKEHEANLREQIMRELMEDGNIDDNKKKMIKSQKDAYRRPLLGRIEWASVGADNIRFKARIDTGAKTTSMHAQNIKEETVEGEKYVRFETIDEQGRKHTLLKPVLSQQRVRSTSGDVSERYVIQENVTIGGRSYKIAINLNDRKTLNYNFLVGRNLLIGNFNVDVSQSFIMGRE